MKIKSLSRDAAAGALSWLLTGTVVLLVANENFCTWQPTEKNF